MWAAGPTPIDEVYLFRNGEEVFAARPGESEVSLEWREEQPPAAGTAWYYVRVHARPGSAAEAGAPRLAWSSPIWVERTP